jgi:hypothetical protein
MAQKQKGVADAMIGANKKFTQYLIIKGYKKLAPEDRGVRGL